MLQTLVHCFYTFVTFAIINIATKLVDPHSFVGNWLSKFRVQQESAVNYDKWHAMPILPWFQRAEVIICFFLVPVVCPEILQQVMLLVPPLPFFFLFCIAQLSFFEVPSSPNVRLGVITLPDPQLFWLPLIS